MDLGLINSTLRDTFEVEITHPVTGEGGFFLEFGSQHNPHTTRRVNAVLDGMRRRKSSTSTVAQDEKDGIDLFLARLVGWRGLKSGGEEQPYDEATARKVLSDPKSYWVRQQALDKIGDPAAVFEV